MADGILLALSHEPFHFTASVNPGPHPKEVCIHMNWGRKNGKVAVLVHFSQREPDMGVRVHLHLNMSPKEVNVITVI